MLLGALLLVLSSCTFSARLLSSPAEYDSWRSVHLATTREGRITASLAYLETYPEGHFSADVSALMQQDEARFYEQAKHSIEGLDWYLAVLPKGPHADEAQFMRQELSSNADEASGAALLTIARKNEKQHRHADLARKLAVDEFDRWLHAAVQMPRWDIPTHELPSELLAALRGGEAPGHCREDECSRIRVREFSLPIQGGGMEPRAIVLELLLRLEENRVREIVLRGPALFTRLWEASRPYPLDPDELDARAQAITWATDRIARAINPISPAPSCERPILPPVILIRSCQGWYIDVEAGDGVSEDDAVRLRGPTSAPPSSAASTGSSSATPPSPPPPPPSP